MSVETIELWQTNQHHELYCDAVAWIEDTPDVRLDPHSAGVSYINGFTYFHYVEFDHRQDLLAFKLKFLDLLKFK